MKSSKNLHIIIGTIICLATMLLFIAFSDKLPESVPVQIKIDGSVGNRLPKPILIYGFPVIFSVVNLLKVLPLAGKEDTKVYNYYIIPGLALVLSIVTLFMALRLQ